MAGLPFASNQQPLKYSTPQVNSYEARKVNIGRITTQVDGGPAQVSALGDLEGLAKGLDKWADVLEQQEKDNQTVEAMEETTAYRDRERAMFDQMEQMQGKDAEAAAAFAQAFYERESKELTGKARSGFQKMIYAKTVNSDRDSGLNRAFAHRRAEFKKREDSVYLGDQAQFLEIASDWRSTPEAIERAAGPFLQRQTDYYLKQGLDPRAANIRANQLFQESMRVNLKSRLGVIMESDPTEFQRIIDGQPALGIAGEGGKKVEGARFALPTDNHHYITSPFGPRSAPKTPKGLGSSDHKGIDLRMPVGTQVKAISGGTIDFAGDKGGYGVAVVIKHDDGTTTSQYGHLSKLNVQKGMRVNAGDVIALSGNTGKSTGPHLDLKVTENGKYIDPAPVLGMTRKGLAGALMANDESKPVMLASLGGMPSGGGNSISKDSQPQTEDGLLDSTWVVSDDAALINEFLSPTDKLEIQKKWEAVKKDQNEAALLSRYKQMRDQFSDLSLADQNLLFRAAIKEIEDLEERSKFKGMWDKDYTIAKEKQEAVDADIIFSFEQTADQQGLNHSQRLEEVPRLKSQGLSAEEADKYIERLEKGRDIETEQNKADTDNLRRLVDEGLIRGTQDINRFALNNGLTKQQREEIITYFENSGPEGALYQAREKIKKAWAYYSGKKEKKFPSEIYDQFMKAAVPGQKLTDDYVRKTVAALIVDGEKKGGGMGYGADMTYGDAVAAGHGDEWLPDVGQKEIMAIRNEARARGFNNLSDTDIRWIKRKMMGLPVPDDKLKGME